MSMSDGAAEGAILAAIVTAPRAWVRISTFGIDGVETVFALIIDGLLDVWPLDDGPAVTLSPWTAEALDVELAEFGSLETPRWVERGKYVPPVRIRKFPGEIDMPSPELVADCLPPEILLDDEGEPVRLWNRTIPLDPRIPPASNGRRANRKPKPKPRPKRLRSA